ncbi:biopolymer transporter ExbD [Spirochaetia bacterium]|nr:biopolymer transporter ExbD [Spirochaetia bacterium]
MNIKRQKRDFIVPMNSMSDVAFLLLIFIMLVSLINYRKEVKIDYPEAAAALRTSAEKNLEIWVDKAGAVYLDGVPSNLSAIEIAITDIYRNAPDTRVHIIADRDTPFAEVNKVLQTLQLLQYRVVSFVVKDA